MSHPRLTYRFDPSYVYDPVVHRARLRNATRGYCRDCVRPDAKGRRRVRLLGDSVCQCPVVCPACDRVWVYSIDIGQEVKRRIAWCRIARHQPFLMCDLPNLAPMPKPVHRPRFR